MITLTHASVVGNTETLMLVAPNGTSSISSIGASAGVAIGECGGTPAETPPLSTYLFVWLKPVLANDVDCCGILREKVEEKSVPHRHLARASGRRG